MWWYQSSKTAKIIWVTLDGAMHMASLQAKRLLRDFCAYRGAFGNEPSNAANLLRKPSYSQFCPKFRCHGNGVQWGSTGGKYKCHY